jgi:hypothetical protein
VRHQKEEEFDPDLDYEPDPGGPDGPTVDPAQVQHYIDLLRSRQRIPIAILAGFGGAVLGAAAWLGLSSLFGLQVGWMAIVVGVLVGVTMRYFGHGIDLPISIAALFMVALGIVAGDLASGCAAAARASKDLGFLDQVARLTPEKVVAIMKGSFDVIDVVFDVTGLVAGVLLSRRRVSVKGIMRQAQKYREAA